MSFTAYFWVIPAGNVMQVGRLWLRRVKGIFLWEKRCGRGDLPIPPRVSRTVKHDCLIYKCLFKCS